MTDLHVSVDGHDVDPVTFEFLFQEDPFPGGHTYELVISGASNTPGLNASDLPLARSVTTQIFYLVDQMKRKEGLTPFSLEWFFNSVESITATDTGWTIRGICSRVLTPPDQDPSTC